MFPENKQTFEYANNGNPKNKAMISIDHNTTPEQLNNLKEGDFVKMNGYEGSITRIEKTKEGNRVKRAIHLEWIGGHSGLKREHIGYIG